MFGADIVQDFVQFNNLKKQVTNQFLHNVAAILIVNLLFTQHSKNLKHRPTSC